MATAEEIISGGCEVRGTLRSIALMTALTCDFATSAAPSAALLLYR